MEIFLVSKSPRNQRFQDAVEQRGGQVYLLEPDHLPLFSGTPTGIVLFEDGPASLDLLRQVRERTRYLNIPVLVVSADVGPQNLIRLRAAGATSILASQTPDEDVIAEIESSDPRPVTADLQGALLEPFTTAVTFVLQEQAATEAFPLASYARSAGTAFGDIVAVLKLSSTKEEAVALNVPVPLATTLAARVLMQDPATLDSEVIQDCVGELLNLIAGQAKAMLLGTPDHFTLSTPTRISAGEEIEPNPGSGCLVVVFRCDAGDFALQLCLGR